MDCSLNLTTAELDWSDTVLLWIPKLTGVSLGTAHGANGLRPEARKTEVTSHLHTGTSVYTVTVIHFIITIIH